MKKRSLDRFVNSFLLILFATNQAVRCSDESKKPKILTLNAILGAITSAPSTAVPRLSDAFGSESLDQKPSPVTIPTEFLLPVQSANLTSTSHSTTNRPFNQTEHRKLQEQLPFNRFVSDGQSISNSNKLNHQSHHLSDLVNGSFARLPKMANRDAGSGDDGKDEVGGSVDGVLLSGEVLKKGNQTGSQVRLPDTSSTNLNSLPTNAFETNEQRKSGTLNKTKLADPILSPGNQSWFSQEAGANATISGTERMSFIFNSINSLINLTNDYRLDKRDPYKMQKIMLIHKNASSSLTVHPKNLSNQLNDGQSSELFKQPDLNFSFGINESTTPATGVNRTIGKLGMPTDATLSIVSIGNMQNVLNEPSITLSSRGIVDKVKPSTLIANQSLISKRTSTKLTGNKTTGSWEPKQSEKVLVYPVLQTNQSNDQSLSAQSKRAPHYLEEKFRKHPDKLTTGLTSSTSPAPERLDRPTPILDTRPLVEDVGSELNFRAIDERLINEEELLHHSGSSLEDGSYEYGNYHGSHHSNLHHANKHNQSKQTLDPSWFEQNCLENCICEANKRWPEVNELSGQSRKTLNCSNNELDDYPTLANELGKHVERLSLAANNIKTLQVNPELFYCERLIELDLSNNQLQQLSISPFSHKPIQHPVVEFHPSHNHYSQKETKPSPSSLSSLSSFSSTSSPSSLLSSLLLQTTTSSPIALLNSTSADSIDQVPVEKNAKITPTKTTTETMSAVQSKNCTTNINRQNLFFHCHRLRVLVLSGNDLNTLSTGCFRGLKRLRELYLDNAQIRFIEKNAFLGANELRLLSLRFNLLTVVHAHMFQHMINLKVLDLTGNQLVYLGAGFFNSLVALQALHIGHNKLRQLSFQCFSGLDGLQVLTIDSNQLESVPRFALQPLKKLKILDMSSNPISKILEDDFSHSFVQLLLLNQLSQLQYVARFSFWDLPYLNELQITHCHEFVHLDEQAIVGAPSLQRLKLDHNAFSQLDGRLLENLARMTIASRRQLKVFLSGNPFHCDCFLKPIYLCAKDQTQCKIELPDRLNITCTFKKSDNSTDGVREKSTKELYAIDHLTDNQLPNECAPTFVPIITPINVTIVKRLRSKLRLSCKAIGSPTPSVYWLQPSGEINKEKLVTRHSLVESDLLSLSHSFQNDGIAMPNGELATEQNEAQLTTNQATSAFLPLSKAGSVLMSSGSPLLSSASHHGSSTLRIGHLTPNDAGLYTCIAENRFSQIRSHVQLITQQLKIELKAENVSTNHITIHWQVSSIFNPPLSEILGNDSNSSTTGGSNVTGDSSLSANASSPPVNLSGSSNYLNLPLEFKDDFEMAIANANNEKSLNQLDYQLLYKMDSFGIDEERQSSAETLGSERIFESNKFFASYESVQINRQLRTFTIAGLRPGTRYKICIAVREPRLKKLDLVHQASLFRKQTVNGMRLKRNLISVESASYLAVGCIHEETVHAAFYARNILKVEKFRLPSLISNALGTAIKFSLICSLVVIVLALFVTAYTWAKQRQRRSAYETPRKTLLSIAGYSQKSDTTSTTPYLTPYSTPSHAANPTTLLQMQNIYSPLTVAAKRH